MSSAEIHVSSSIINRDDAEEFTQSLGQIVGGSWRQIALADRMGVPAALGLSTGEWVRTRLGGYVQMDPDERRPVTRELTTPLEQGGYGMTQQGAADVLGVGIGTVNRDLHADEPIPNRTPEPGCGRDDGPFGDEPVPNGTPEPESPGDARPHVARNSGDFEWYSPPEYVSAARLVLGGIDLDPASSAIANETVRATRFYTEADDGLSQPWGGRVWMNPPYAQPACDRFCTRLAREFRAGAVTAACVLVNNATETAWFQEMAVQASALCFPRGRIRFRNPGQRSAPLQGQAVLYLGHGADGFRAQFLRFGFVVAP